ncbi:uncharacterized protein FOMMEDRAFT_160921 [Fomitiporia mediterranea MF3/22]|uniref:uncharacterized protein n=1 Tax=Fomitiporia mediterranea (strain MF3/22) TaxID=694068 RepID=UPI0004407279|nr:uncharacterized protein FOMMEDRAFT_160921 [Fomitiporia mediterranea MF3/22]EJC99314.1 hypothetical protein FOMMEDRAFT_160921 [Fomitiporia mediterranea MF3/22]
MPKKDNTIDTSFSRATSTGPYPQAEFTVANSGAMQFTCNLPPVVDAADSEAIEGGNNAELDGNESTSMPSNQSSTNDQDEHIPRPTNSFILFRTATDKRNIPELDNVKRAGARSKVIAQLWKDLKPEERQVWDQRAEDIRKEHQKRYPNYRYQPKPRRPRIPKRSGAPDVEASAERRRPSKRKSGRNVPDTIVTSPNVTTTESFQTRQPQEVHAPQPVYAPNFLQPSPNSLQPNGFDLSTFERNSSGTRPENYSNTTHTPSGHPQITQPFRNEIQATHAGVQSMQMTGFPGPSMPTYAHPDPYASAPCGRGMQTDSSFWRTTTGLNDTDANSLFNQWFPQNSNVYGGMHTSGPFGHPGSNGTAFNTNYASGSQSNQYVSSHPWDFATPTFYAQTGPTWQYS